MQGIETLRYAFNVPSVLSFDWLFEFTCTLQYNDTQQIEVSIEDTTIGSVTAILPHNDTFWKTKLAVWAICGKMAISYASKTNTEDNKIPILTNYALEKHTP